MVGSVKFTVLPGLRVIALRFTSRDSWAVGVVAVIAEAAAVRVTPAIVCVCEGTRLLLVAPFPLIRKVPPPSRTFVLLLRIEVGVVVARLKLRVSVPPRIVVSPE